MNRCVSVYVHAWNLHIDEVLESSIGGGECVARVDVRRSDRKKERKTDRQVDR